VYNNTTLAELIFFLNCICTCMFLYMPVEFNSLKVAALVDSGSSINIMSDQLHYSLPHKCKSELNFEAIKITTCIIRYVTV
jgi:hypothetical protein